MTFGKKLRRAVVTRPLGKWTIKTARSTANWIRSLLNPGIPSSQQFTTVRYKGKKITFLHRRTKSDRAVLQQCFQAGQYDMPDGPHGDMMKRLHQHILARGKQPLIVDCGANIGASVVWFANRYHRAHIVAVEPAPDNFSLLLKNTAGLDVVAVKAGISSQDHVGRLTNLEEGGWAYQTAELGEGPEIKMISLQTLLAEVPADCEPFILKVDIEGAENLLFTAGFALLNSFPLVICEPHDWLLPGQATSLAFLRFHVANGREIAIKDENLASIAWNSELMKNI